LPWIEKMLSHQADMQSDDEVALWWDKKWSKWIRTRCKAPYTPAPGSALHPSNQHPIVDGLSPLQYVAAPGYVDEKSASCQNQNEQAPSACPAAPPLEL